MCIYIIFCYVIIIVMLYRLLLCCYILYCYIVMLLFSNFLIIMFRLLKLLLLQLTSLLQTLLAKHMFFKRCYVLLFCYIVVAINLSPSDITYDTKQVLFKRCLFGGICNRPALVSRKMCPFHTLPIELQYRLPKKKEEQQVSYCGVSAVLVGLLRITNMQ